MATRRKVSGAAPVVRLLVLTDDELFYRRLQELAVNCAWRIVRATSIDEGETLIRTVPPPLVVYDSDSGDGNWREGLMRLTGLPEHPCVLLASAVADDNFLHEVLRNRGYDILPKSAPSENLIRCLNFAWFWFSSRRS